MPLTAGAVAAPGTRARSRAEPIVRRGDQVQLVALDQQLHASARSASPSRTARRATGSASAPSARNAPFIGQVLADGRVALPGFN